MIRRTAGILSIVLAAAIGLSAQSMHLAAGSTWKMNVAASDFGSMPAPKSDMFVITKDTDKMLIWHGNTVAADGKVTRFSWSGPEDGALRPVDANGDKASFTPDGKGHWVMADGTTMEQVMSVSDDKMTVTFNNTFKDKSGKESHTKTVYVRSDKAKM